MKKKAKEKKVSVKKSRFLNSKAWVFVAIGLFVVALIALNFVNVPSEVTTMSGKGISGNAIQNINIVIGDGVCSPGESPRSPDCNVGTSPPSSSSSKIAKTSFIREMFAGWSEGRLDLNIAKYLLFFLVFMLIFSVLGLFLGKIIGAFTSLIVAFLAVAYITPDEVYTILTTYTALGLTLSIAVPFFIMALFSLVLTNPFRFVNGRLVVNTRGRTRMYQYFFVSLLWLLFVGFIIYKAIVGWSLLSHGMLIVMGVVILFAIVIIIRPSIFSWLGSHFALMAQSTQNTAATNLRRQNLRQGNP
jgi:hypothetical protein